MEVAGSVGKKLTNFVRLGYQGFFGTPSGKRNVKEIKAASRDIQLALDALDNRWGEDIQKSDDHPVFLFSAGWRSGSTLLQRMIIKDGSIEMWGEPFTRSNIIQTMMSQLIPFNKEWPTENQFADFYSGPKVDEWIATTSPSVPNLVAGHIQFFQNLFQPANGKRWGVKEVRCGVPHAKYLKWLFPNAKFVFLYRNPYDSFASFRDYLVFDFVEWPHKPIIKAQDYARLWTSLTHDFLANGHTVEGMTVSYEDLKLPETSQRLGNYLGISVPLLSEMSFIRGPEGIKKETPKQKRKISKAERFIMRMELGELARQLNYE